MQIDQETLNQWLTRIAADCLEFVDSNDDESLDLDVLSSALSQSVVMRLTEVAARNVSPTSLVALVRRGMLRGCGVALEEVSRARLQ